MEIYAYGEDALTLWAIQNKLSEILVSLRDPSSLEQCQAFFRPSFGRSGGDYSAQFGEFDFLLLTVANLYLGESKWDRSSERVEGGILGLRREQQLRHDLFKFYLEEWAYGGYSDWPQFELQAKPKLEAKGIPKPIAPSGSLLASNLQTVLRVIKEHYDNPPTVRNVLLYLHSGGGRTQFPVTAGRDFEVVVVDYSLHAFDYFIRIRV